MAARNLHTNVYINGINNLSGPVSKGVNSSINSLNKLSAQARSLSMLSMQTGRTFATMAAGMALPLVYAGKKALEFEDKMADVSKVTNVDVGSDAFKKMGDEVKNLSVYLGRTATETADLFTNLAQGGTAVSDLAEIGKIAGQVSVAFGVSANAAGEAFAHIQNVMNLTIDKTGSVMDAINELSNTRNATAERILTFFTSGGSGVARSMDIQGKDIAAFGATLIAMGESGEEAGTIMRRFAKGINKSASLTKAFKEAGGGAEGLVAVLSKGLKSADPKAFFRGFGEYGNQIELLARTMDGPKGLVGALGLVKNEAGFADSVLKEFANKNSTGMARLRKEWARFQVTVIELGNALLPVLTDVLNQVSPMLTSTTEWISKNKELTKDIVKSVLVLATFSAGIAAVSFGLSGILTITAAVTKVMAFFAVGGGGYAAVTWATTYAEGLAYAAYTGGLLTSAALIGAGAIAGIGLAFYGAYKYIKPFRQSIIRIVEALTTLGNHSWDILDALVHFDFARLGKIGKAMELESNININRRLFEDEKEHQSERIQELRAGRRKDRGQEVSPQQSYQGEMLTVSKSGVSQYAMPSDSIQFSPVFHFNAPVGPAGKEAVLGAVKEAQYLFEKQMKEHERRKERKKL